MSLENQQQTTVQNPATPPSTAATPPAGASGQAPLAPAAPPVVAPPAGDPAWVGPRIAQAKHSAEVDLAKSLGFASVEEMKAAAEAGKRAAEAAKTDATKLAETTAALAAANQTIATQRAVFVTQAAAEMATLSPEHQAIIKDLAGDDAESQILAIRRLRPTWAAPAPQQQQQQQTAKTAVAPPVTTTAAPPGPSTQVTAPPPPTSYAAIYEDLKAKNPMKASAFYQAYGSQITAERAAARAGK